MYIDIETIPFEGIENTELYQTLVDKISAPSNYKDPEIIQKYIDNQKLNLHRTFQLSPSTSQVACITILSDDKMKTYSLNDRSEYSIVSFAFDTLLTEFSEDIIGFNTRHFDFPFLLFRSLMIGINIADKIKRYKNVLYDHIDIYHEFREFKHMSQDYIYQLATGNKIRIPFINYYDFEGTRKEYIEYLIEHNREDVAALATIYPIINRPF